MKAPLLKEKVIVKVGNRLFRCIVYAKSHKSFFLKDDLVQDKQVIEYFFADENIEWFHNITEAKKHIDHPIIQTSNNVWEIVEEYQY